MKTSLTRTLGFISVLCSCCLPVLAQTIGGIINSYYAVNAVNTSSNVLTLNNTNGLTPGVKVLIIQMKGASIDKTNTASFGNITGVNDAGNYEFNYVCSITGNTVLLKYRLINRYDPAGMVQLVTVPQYNVAIVVDAVRSQPWNAGTGTGGIVVFDADTVLLNSLISVNGEGFGGGAFINFPTPTYDCVWATNVTNYYLQLPPSPSNVYTGGTKGEGIADFMPDGEYGRGKQANGGGGGNNHNTGGAGGANYGAGGNGGRRTSETTFSCHGTNPGIGGASLASLGYSPGTNRIFLGGGGGASHQNNSKGMAGGNGGGIIIITANVLSGSGNLMANGASPVNYTNTDPSAAEGDGGGGGGAGGTIILNVNEVRGSIEAQVKGAHGSDASRGVSDCTGPGGGGGGGVIWMKGPDFSPAIIPVISGGSNGVVSMLSTIAACQGQANNATPGLDGTTLTGYVQPLSAPLVCQLLAVAELKNFQGHLYNNQAVLEWQMQPVAAFTGYAVERSVDQAVFTLVAQQPNTGALQYTVNDHQPLAGTTWYRLKLFRKDGNIVYSSVIKLAPVAGTIPAWQLFPNPVSSELTLTVLTSRPGNTRITIYNVVGQPVYQASFSLTQGYNKLKLPVARLSKGVHWVQLEHAGVLSVRRFIKAG